MAVLAQWMVALSQGLVFFHAGDELLRSKSLDRDSYDSGESNFGILGFDSLLLSFRMCKLHLPSQFNTAGRAGLHPLPRRPAVQYESCMSRKQHRTTLPHVRAACCTCRRLVQPARLQRQGQQLWRGAASRQQESGSVAREAALPRPRGMPPPKTTPKPFGLCTPATWCSLSKL